MPKARRAQGATPELVALAEQTASRADALSTLVNNVTPPPVHSDSHISRTLALNLLAQAAFETLAFVRSGDDNTRMEAALSLGEALRLLPQVREQYAAERRVGA
jgi:hypothetical protein